MANIVEYEFRGNLLPLSKAFSKAEELFKKYVQEAFEADEAIQAQAKKTGKQVGSIVDDTFNEYVSTIEDLMEKIKSWHASDYDSSAAHKYIRREFSLMARQMDKLKKYYTNSIKQANKELSKEEDKKKSKVDYTSTASQFKAAVQSEQLQNFMQAIPTLPKEVVTDINSYIELWKEVSAAYRRGEVDSQTLADATATLDTKTKEYVGSLKILNHEQKNASNAMERLLQGVISRVGSIETWNRWIKDGISLLGDYIESLNFLEVAVNNISFKNYVNSAEMAADITEYFNEKLDQARWALGLNATALNQSAAIFISFGNAIGMTGKTVSTFAENVTQLAVDMASLYNKDVTEVATALKSALAGNTRAMMNYGISVHDATLNEWMLEKGLNKTMNGLSETSQAMIRYLYIMEKTSGAQGDLSRTLKSPSNQLKVLANQLNLLKQNLSSIFNLFIYPAVRILNSILIPLNAFISTLTALANNNYSQSIGAIANAADDATEALDSASEAAVGLTGLDEINQKSESTTITGIDADVQSLVDALGVYDGFAESTSKLTQLMKTLGEALAPIWAMLSNTNVLDAFIQGIDLLAVALTPVQKVLEAIKAGFEYTPEWFQTMIGWLMQGIGTLTNLAVVIGMVSAAWAVLTTVMKSELFLNFISILKTLYLHFLYLGESIYAAIAKFVTWIATMVKARIEALKTSIANKGLAATLVSIAKSALMAVVNLVKLIGKLIIQGAKAVWTAFKNLILSKSLWGVALATIAAGGLAALAVAGVVGAAVLIGKSIQNSNEVKVNANAMATGGVVTGPTFALIGEGKYDEAVVPLGDSPQFKSMKEGIASEVINKINVGGASSNRPIILNVNGKELARAILPDLKQAIPQTGVRLTR